MLGALNIWLLEVITKASELPLRQSVSALEIEFEGIVSNLNASKRSYEYLRLVASDPSGSGNISSNQPNDYNNFKWNHHVNGNTNAIIKVMEVYRYLLLKDLST
jgi:hypothetical protein